MGAKKFNFPLKFIKMGDFQPEILYFWKKISDMLLPRRHGGRRTDKTLYAAYEDGMDDNSTKPHIIVSVNNVHTKKLTGQNALVAAWRF